MVRLVVLAVTVLALAGSGAHADDQEIRFASPTVVSMYAPGFEPDVVVDASSMPSRGRVYSSWPNGFSSTITYLHRSDDGGATFHPVAGAVGGKPTTCVGGGDSELQVSRKDGQLLLADLQGLTNFSTSSSADGGDTFLTSCTGITGLGVDRQWIAIDDNGGTSAIGPGAADGRGYLVYDNLFQNAGSFAGNSPVINATSDGVNYGGCLDPGAIECKGPAAVISTEDDIVGNVLVDGNPASPRYHAIYQVRGSSNSRSVLLSSCRGAATGTATTASATAALCTNPTPGDLSMVNPHWTDHVVAALPTGYVAKSFCVGAIDTAGYLYVTWVQYPRAKSGADGGPGQVMLATSRNGGLTWSTPLQLNPPSQPTVVFPWIAAGDPGRVDVVWYSTGQASYHDRYGPDSIDDGLWDVHLAQSLDALSTEPSVAVTRVSDHHVKYGDVSTGGLGGAADRSLGDFLQVAMGLRGEAVISYVDDTSGNRSADSTFGSGQTPVEASGPPMVARQVAGPSLLATVGSVGSGRPAVGGATDPSADAYLALAGLNTAAPPALDIARVAVAQPDGAHLAVTMDTGDPALKDHLSTQLGGAFANWRVRWAGRYGTSGKDGQVWYVGMQAGPDGAPEFYAGNTASIDTTKSKLFAYPIRVVVPGSITGGRITWTVPLDVVGSPGAGDRLFSVTGFTSTSVLPDRPVEQTLPTGSGQVGDEDTLGANLIDAAPSFSFALSSSGSASVPPSSTDGRGRGNPLPATGAVLWLPLAGALVLVAVLRRRRLS